MFFRACDIFSSFVFGALMIFLLSLTGKINAKSIKINENKIPASTLNNIFSFKSSSIIILFSILFFSLNLYANEQKIFLLDSIISNFDMKFKTSRYSFYCKPYAVLGIDDIPIQDKECYKSVIDYYKVYPNDFYKTYKFLKVEQMYHIDFREQQCIIYVKGQKTLSEILLENGLAVLKPHFMDREFEARFKKAERLAKENKRGIYSQDIKLKQCIYKLHVQRH